MVPIGGIIDWSGAIVDIPPRFALCDGNNGTPDLRDKMLIGAGSTYAVGANGGVIQHNHVVTQPGHYHELGSGANVQAGTDMSNNTSQETPVITCNDADNMPPYYALAKIMRIS